MVRDVVYADAKGRTCKINWDPSKPNGTPRKLCDITRLLNLGWKPRMELKDGIKLSYKDFLSGGGKMDVRN